MLSFVLILCVVIGKSHQCIQSITTASGTKAPGHICSGDLIFNEEFDSFDFQTWNHEITAAGGGNWEFQVYLNNRTNSYVHDGKLYIKPTLTSDTHGERYLRTGTLKLYGGSPADQCTNPSDWGCERTGTTRNIINPITSARIRTVESFSFCYGRVEIRAKLPTGDWLWPAIWMLPRYNEYGTWPASGEIDIVESRGNKNLTINGKNIGSDLSLTSLHFGPYSSLNGYEHAHFEKSMPPAESYDEQFHRFQMEWTEDYMKFSINDQEIGTVPAQEGGFWEKGNFGTVGAIKNPWIYGTKMSPFDKQFYFVLNVAVGGVNNYFPDNAINPGGKPWSNRSPRAADEFWSGREQWLSTWQQDINNGENAALQIDYIKVWAI